MPPEANDEVHVNTVTPTMTPPTTGPRHIAEERHKSLSSPDVNETECPRFNKRMSSKGALRRRSSRQMMNTKFGCNG